MSPIAVALPESSMNKVITAVIVLGALGGAYYFLRKVDRDEKQEESLNIVDSSPEAQQADYISQLLGKSGNMSLDLDSAVRKTKELFKNIDEDKIIEYGKKITNLPEVQKHYKSQNRGAVLLTDLKDAMNDDEYQRFIANVTAATNAAKARAAENEQFYITANPTISGRTTTTAFREDAVSYNPKVPSKGFSNPIFEFKKGVTIGKVLKRVSLTVPASSKSKGYTTSLYLVQGTNGPSKNVKFYVLVSQVKRK